MSEIVYIFGAGFAMWLYLELIIRIYAWVGLDFATAIRKFANND